MIKETLRGFRTGELSRDDALAGLMQDGMRPDQAEKVLTAYESGPSYDARRLQDFRETSPVIGSVVAPTGLPTTADQIASDKKALEYLDVKAKQAADERAKKQAEIDLMPSVPGRDLAHAALQIAPEAIRMGAQVGQFLTGGALGKDTENLMAGVSADITDLAASEKLKAQQELMAESIGTGDPGVVLDFVRQNPFGTGVLSAPSLAASAGGLGIGSGLAARVLRNALKLNPQQAGALAADIANYGNAGLNAGQTFAQNADEGANPFQNLLGSLGAALQTRLIGKGLGGGAEGLLASRIAGGGTAPASMRQLGASVAQAAAKGAADELNDNLSVEHGTAFVKGERPDYVKAVAEAIPDMLAGGLLGGASNVRATNPPAPKTVAAAAPPMSVAVPVAQKRRGATAPAAQSADQTQQPQGAAAVLAGLKGLFKADSQGSSEASSGAENAAAAQAAPAAEVQPEETKTVKMVLQNRDRSTPASISQMTKIAAHPDYGMLSESRSFSDGAPVVAYAGNTIPQDQLGRQSYAVTVNHDRIPVQYAVVEAGSVLTSNSADGIPNKQYADGTVLGARAIAGNGRIAGLTRAYDRGTAKEYRKELKEDATMHGIPGSVIDGMKAPVLVRIMPDDRVTPDIGDVSNTNTQLNLSAIEQAANDVTRLDIPALKFDEETGRVTSETIRDFAQRMPASEQGNLIDVDGTPTRQAVERFKAATFKAAYDSDELVRLYAQETDPELKGILNAMGEASAKYARLKPYGDFDISGLVASAVEMIINAKRTGHAYEEYLSNANLLTEDPAAAEIGLRLVKDLRSQKRMAEVLTRAAEFAYFEATKPDVDLWGDVHKATRQELIEQITKAPDDTAAEQSAEEQPAGQSAAGAAESESGSSEAVVNAEQQSQQRDEYPGPQAVEQQGGSESAREDVQRGETVGQESDAGRATSPDATEAVREVASAESKAEPAVQLEAETAREPVAESAQDQSQDSQDDSQQELQFSRHGRTAARDQASAATSEQIAEALRSDKQVGKIFSRLQDQGLVEVVTSERELPRSAESFEDSSIQGAYDEKGGKVYLVAENLSAESAASVFLHEVGVHMTNADRSLEPIIKQARIMVINGFKAGDATARRVKERLVEAGEIKSAEDSIPMSAAEEAMAYTVEEASRMDDRSPWGRWWGRLASAIKSWLVKHGIRVELSPENLADIALGAAERVKGAPLKAGGDLRFSRRSKGVFGKDELGAKTFVPGKKAYDFAARGLRALVLERAHLVPMPPELRMQFRAMKAEEDKGFRTAMQAADLMKTMPEQERSLLSDVIEEEIQSAIVPPRAIVDTAAFMSSLIDEQSKELVELGMLSQESYDRYKGRYLPRFYAKGETSKDVNFFRKLFPASPVKGIYGDHLKGRGIFKEAESQTVKDFVKLGWEVRDPDWKWDGEKLVPKSGQESTDKTPPDGTKVGLWRDWSKTEREQMGEIRDAGFRFTMGQIETSKILALGRFYKWLAGQSEYVRNSGSDGYTYVAPTAIADTGGVKRYGALAGKWVRTDVFDSISKTDQVESVATRAWKQALAIWKEGKTAMNPVSHYNNTVGNWLALSFAGVGLTDARAYVQGFRSLKKQDESYKEAEEAGLFTGSFTREEVVQSLPPAFREYLDAAEDKSIIERSGDVMMTVLTWGLRGKLSKMYELEDSLFKMVLYQHARKKKLSPEEAVDYVHQYIFTYDDLPKGARVLRDTVLPFFSWTYKALPMLAKTAMVYPWRFAAPAVIMAAVNKFSYLASVAGDDGDWLDKLVKAWELEKAERELLPKYMEGVGIMLNPKFIRLWRDASTGLPQYLNVSYSAPGGTLFDVENQMGGIPFPETVMPNTPWLSAYAALIANKDTFSGFEISRETDTSWEAASKRIAWLWKQMTPAIAAGNYHWTRLMNGVASELGQPLPGGYTGVDRYGSPMPISVALQNLAGLKVRTVDMEKEYEKGMRDIQYEVRSVKSEARSTARLAAKGAVTKEVLKNQLDTMREKTAGAAERAREKRSAFETVKKLSKQ